MNPDRGEYSRFHIWFLATRPKTLWAAITPVVIGTALAWEAGGYHLAANMAALIGAVMIQMGTNFANDLIDFKRDVDTKERLGPLRVTQAGLVTATEMKRATVIAFGFAFLAGIYLVYRGGLPIVIIGLSSIAFGILYTGGPFPLGYKGLGDIFVLIFFGPVAVAGTFYVITLDINWLVILAGLSPGMLSVAILTVNNLRDIDTDRESGKRTLQVRFGKPFARVEYVVMVCVACFFPVVHYLVTGHHSWAMISSISIIAAVPLIRKVISVEGQMLNDVLAGTGKLLALYGFLFSIGWLL